MSEVESINKADSLVFQSRVLFKEMEGKVDAKGLDEVKNDIDELEKQLREDKNDASAIQKKMDAVNEKIQKLSTELYQKAASEHAKARGGAGHQSDGAAPDDSEDEKPSGENVVDAEFTEKDDKKKDQK